MVLFIPLCLGCPGIPPEIPDDPPPLIENIVFDPPIYTPSEDFQVSEEVYDATFKQIEGLILGLNTLVQDGLFSQWRSYLSETYIQKYSDPMYLAELSELPILKRNNIKLRNLRQYFDAVVVRSRAHAKLDKIVFLNDNRVIALMNIDGEMTILYQLSKEGDQWKITVW